MIKYKPCPVCGSTESMQDNPVFKKHSKECPLCHTPRPHNHDYEWAKGLSVRSTNILIAEGFQSKKEVSEFIKIKSPLICLNGVGKISHKEICEWAKS